MLRNVDVRVSFELQVLLLVLHWIYYIWAPWSYTFDWLVKFSSVDSLAKTSRRALSWTVVVQPVDKFCLCFNLFYTLQSCSHARPVQIRGNIRSILQRVFDVFYWRFFVLPQTVIKSGQLVSMIAIVLRTQSSIVHEHIWVPAWSVALVIPCRGILLRTRRMPLWAWPILRDVNSLITEACLLGCRKSSIGLNY